MLTTKRENDVIKLLVQGKTNKAIAAKLFITEHTVKAHIEHIYEKYQVHSRVELVIKLSKTNYFIEHGIE